MGAAAVVVELEPGARSAGEVGDGDAELDSAAAAEARAETVRGAGLVAARGTVAGTAATLAAPKG